jgi:hypothetical protein
LILEEGRPARRETKMNAPASTVDALMYQLRTDGIAALPDLGCQRRLADLSTPQVREVLRRLIRIRSNYPSITDELLFWLGEQL